MEKSATKTQFICEKQVFYSHSMSYWSAATTHLNMPSSSLNVTESNWAGPLACLSLSYIRWLDKVRCPNLELSLYHSCSPKEFEKTES